MDLSINVAVDFTATQFAAAAGLTLPTYGEDWEFLASSPKPTGLTLTFMKLTGTPTALGSWSVQINAVDGSYNFLQAYQVPVNVIDPNAVPDPEPEEPGEEPEPAPVTAGQKVADFLGQGDNPDVADLAGEHHAIITVMARAYTRGGGFTDGAPNEEIAAVITTATARLVANPEQIDYSVGGTRIGRGFQGWSLGETAVLNRYRKKAL